MKKMKTELVAMNLGPFNNFDDLFGQLRGKLSGFNLDNMVSITIRANNIEITRIEENV